MTQRHFSISRLMVHLLIATAMVGGSLWSAAQAQEYVPPDRGLPGRREGGGTRGNCLRSDTRLLALIPNSNYGTTLSEYPTFFWYVPHTTTQSAEFVLLDEDDNEVYKSTFQISENPGIISHTLPADGTIAPLEIGKDYHWYFSLICDTRDRSGDIFAEGWIQRVEPSPELADQLATSALSDRPTIYAQAGIWYDALSTLANLYQAEPTNSQLANHWLILLRSVGLEGIASQPLIDCCSPADSESIETTQEPFSP